VRLVAKGTIEEQILSLHASKRTLVANVLEGTDAAARVSTSELIDLIREGATARLIEEGEGDEGDEASTAAPAAKARAARAPSSTEEEGLKRGQTKAGTAAAQLQVPAWLFDAGPAGETAVESFRAFLLERMAESSANVYASALGRFMIFASAVQQRGETDGRFEVLAARYLRAIESGDIPAAKSYLQIARAMLAKLRLFVSSASGATLKASVS
jgi:hypothetical protein